MEKFTHDHHHQQPESLCLVHPNPRHGVLAHHHRRHEVSGSQHRLLAKHSSFCFCIEADVVFLLDISRHYDSMSDHIMSDQRLCQTISAKRRLGLNILFDVWCRKRIGLPQKAARRGIGKTCNAWILLPAETTFTLRYIFFAGGLRTPKLTLWVDQKLLLELHELGSKGKSSKIEALIVSDKIIKNRMSDGFQHLRMIAKMAAVPPPRLWPTQTKANLSVPCKSDQLVWYYQC